MSEKTGGKSSKRQITKTGSNSSKKGAQPSPEAKASRRTKVENEGGPREWLYPILESAYTKLVPREHDEAAEGVVLAAMPADAVGAGTFESRLQPGKDESVLSAAPQSFWIDRLTEYKRRKAAVAISRAAMAVGPPGPIIPGLKNWAPLGPSVVMNGQAQGSPAVGGRIAGIAVAPGGQIVYAASANGGVFRSDDGGMSWQSLMDAFDVDPTNLASTSLACGAIAIDKDDPNRVYVGTGEGNTNALFGQRIVNALPAYRGVGLIRSDDGGQTWTLEPTAANAPPLAGKAFFALAIDPASRENVIAATTEGLYQRVPSAGGGVEWVLRRPGLHSSVVASFSGTTRFFASGWGQGIFQSIDGANWSPLGTGLPAGDVGRIELCVQPNNPNVIYAVIVNTAGALRGVFRLDVAGGVWKQLSNAPDILPGGAQGDYDLAIAVDPADQDLIYLGGSYYNDPQFWPASVWRCRVQASGSGYKMTGDSIGVRAHADVHVLVHTPGDPNSLWVGCDGGIFLNRDPRGSSNFSSRNSGLACLCPNYFAQHPTDPNILFCGLQDNGTARTGGGTIWRHVNGGDGGYCLINWADPQKVLVFANGSLFRATDGGQDHNSWSQREFTWSLMTEPIVGPPYNPAHPEEALIVALGSGEMVNNTLRRVVFLSSDFGATWPTANSIPIPTTAGIFSMKFASATRFFVGTTAGEVFRVDNVGGHWNVSRLDNSPAGPLGLVGLVSDISIDWSDPSHASIYISFGGAGDYRHVWHFNGARWEARSGAVGANSLLDVEHNAIVVDRVAPDNIYVGADIGVWHSPDRGQNWETLPNGLPDAPVFDLQIHPTRRLLRATTHGRGLYEYQI